MRSYVLKQLCDPQHGMVFAYSFKFSALLLMGIDFTVVGHNSGRQVFANGLAPLAWQPALSHDVSLSVRFEKYELLNL